MARDLFHLNFREALIKEGWKITHDPLRIPIEVSYLEIDIAAEFILAAEKGEEKIAVEIKSFLNKSFLNNFHEAMGQYLDYKSALEDFDQHRIVFLALSVDTFNHRVFQSKFIQKRLKEEEAKLIIFDPIINEIIKWIK